jgi:hypothetical protein
VSELTCTRRRKNERGVSAPQHRNG